MRTALLLLAILVACVETETRSPEPARRYSLREDALGCFKATRVRRWIAPKPPYFFRLDSMHATGWFDYPPGVRAAWPTAWEIVREEHTWRAWSADSLTDSVRVSVSDGFVYSAFIFDLRSARDTFAGFEAYGTDVNPEKRRRIVVTRVRCADYPWVLMPDSEYPRSK